MRAEAWKYLLSVSKPDRSQELSAERDRKVKDYLRHDKHNVEILQKVRAELRRYSGRGPLGHVRDAERSALLGNAENLKCFENITVASSTAMPVWSTTTVWCIRCARSWGAG